jgi:cyclopropane-fatty-acyl-phospholipid synthase
VDLTLTLKLFLLYIQAGYIDCDNFAEFTVCILKLGVSIPQMLFNRVALARNRQGIHESLNVADIHYNLGNDLYQNMLDEGMSYTCGLWYPETETLEEAQINKLDIIGRKLKLKPGMTVLDIGGGFGAAAKYLAQNFGVSVTVYNISKEQVKYGRENCKDVDVTFVIADYRTATGEFDAIYSIGFFEHVGHQNYAGYFKLVDRCLKPEGLALTHTILAADHQTCTDPFLSKYIFPGGELPYMKDLLTESAKSKLVTEDVQSFSKSYAKTLHCWNDNFVKDWDKIKHNYEHELDGKFYRLWLYYLGFCEGVFLERTAQLCQIVHSKYGRKEEYYSVRDQRA